MNTLKSPPAATEYLDPTQESTAALFLDFDGTLVNIAQSPGAIDVRPDLAMRLEALSFRLDGRLAIVSGRSLEDIASHLGGDLSVAQAGSHGAARRLANGEPLGEQPHGLTKEIVNQLSQFAARNELRYEKKTHGGALHYRENPGGADAAHAFAAEIASQHGLALKTGKCVVELVHKGADKGSAVRAFMQIGPFAGSMPIFVGDDVTDEDGFAACEELGGFGVLVGEPRETRARYRLASVDQVHQWLGL